MAVRSRQERRCICSVRRRNCLDGKLRGRVASSRGQPPDILGQARWWLYCCRLGPAEKAAVGMPIGWRASVARVSNHWRRMNSWQPVPMVCTIRVVNKHRSPALFGALFLCVVSCAQTPERDIRPATDARLDTSRPNDATAERVDVANAFDQGIATDSEPEDGALADVPSCPDGTELCDGVCVDTNTSTDHCGGCGISCNTGGGQEACSECRNRQCCNYDCRNVPNCPL